MINIKRKINLTSKNKKEISSFLLKLYIVLSLFFPAYQSNQESCYYIEIYYANIVLAVYIIYNLIISKEWKKKRSHFLDVFMIILTAYSLLSYYFNARFLHWFGEQFNNTFAFCFFGLLLYMDCIEENRREDMIAFLIHCIIISSVCALVFYCMGYSRIEIVNNKFNFLSIEDCLSGYGEKRFSWIYMHKSQCVLMNMMFGILFVKFKNKFRNKITFLLSEGLIFTIIWIAHSWTGIAATGIVVFGYVLDWIQKEKQNFNPKMLVSFVLVGGAAIAVFVFKMLPRFLGERDLFSLGYRTSIWKNFIKYIFQHPKGMGMDFNKIMVNVGNFDTNNGHSVFLNAMLRFSMPVGLCFIYIFLVCLIQAVRKNKNNFTICGILGILIMLNIDYSLLSYEVSMFFFLLYLCFFYKKPLHRKKHKRFSKVQNIQ